MTLNDYFKKSFWEDVEKIPTEKPNKTILLNPKDFFVDEEILFYGGKDWKSYDTDINLIDENNRENFIFSLLISSTLDYYLKNNTNPYGIKLKYALPKLGWCGYGPHFEHPYKIIKKWIDKQDSHYDLYSKNKDLKELFEAILLDHPQINAEKIKDQILNNKLNIPRKFNDPVYFEFLADDNILNWKEIISNLLVSDLEHNSNF